MRSVEHTFSLDRTGVAVARRLAEAVVRGWGASDALCFDVSVLVSELVSNALAHAHTGGVISIDELVSGVHIGVSDRCANLPTLGRGGPNDESGRGLRMVERMADSWGVAGRCHGKTVWFEISGALQHEDADVIGAGC